MVPGKVGPTTSQWLSYNFLTAEVGDSANYNCTFSETMLLIAIFKVLIFYYYPYSTKLMI
jgi:hypothetical protein